MSLGCRTTLKLQNRILQCLVSWKVEVGNLRTSPPPWERPPVLVTGDRDFFLEPFGLTVGGVIFKGVASSFRVKVSRILVPVAAASIAASSDSCGDSTSRVSSSSITDNPVDSSSLFPLMRNSMEPAFGGTQSRSCCSSSQFELYLPERQQTFS